MAYQVFISYSSKDQLVADAICGKLEAPPHRIRCWIAHRDIPAGESWDEYIVDALAECKVMVLVFSSNANESEFVKMEVPLAVRNKLTIIPFRIEATEPTKALQLYLYRKHWLDAITEPLEQHLDRLVLRVHANLNLNYTEEKPSKAMPNVKVGSQTASPPVRKGKIPSQRDVMKELIYQFGLDKERVVREYAAAEQRGDVVRKRNESGLTAEGYARALWADGVKHRWLPGLD